MKHKDEHQLPAQVPADIPPEIQQGTSRGAGKDERLKHEAKQHPQRDEPRVDSVEPGDMPS
jgi:hypothetical protein